MSLLALTGCRTDSPPKVVAIPNQFARSKSEPAAQRREPAPSPGLPFHPSVPWPVNWTNSWISLADWAHFNGLPPPEKTEDHPKPAFRLNTRWGPLTITATSQVLDLDGMSVWTSHPIQLVRGQPSVFWLDVRKTLQPSMWLGPNPLPSPITVVIDPGHGGRDTGTMSLDGRFQEETFTLDWAKRVARLAAVEGWNVVLTRTNDYAVSIPERVAVADQARADLFVSLHFNSTAPESLAGIETYCLTPVGLPSNLVRSETDDVRQVFPNNAFDEANLIWAFRFQKALLAATGAVDRGVRRARFPGVLRWQNRPAVLIEGGYLSNPVELKRITAEAYREKLAHGVIHAVKAAMKPIP